MSKERRNQKCVGSKDQKRTHSSLTHDWTEPTTVGTEEIVESLSVGDYQPRDHSRRKESSQQSTSEKIDVLRSYTHDIGCETQAICRNVDTNGRDQEHDSTKEDGRSRIPIADQSCWIPNLSSVKFLTGVSRENSTDYGNDSSDCEDWSLNPHSFGRL